MFTGWIQINNFEMGWEVQERHWFEFICNYQNTNKTLWKSRGAFWGKVMFLQVCVILFTGGEYLTPPWPGTPPDQVHPRDQVHPPVPGTPHRPGTPHWPGTLLGPGTPPRTRYVPGTGGCTWSRGCTWSGGVPGPNRVPGQWGVPGLWGTWSWGGVPGLGGTWSGVYLVPGGVPGPGRCTWSWGVCTWSWGCTWSVGYLVWGVYLVLGGVPPRPGIPPNTEHAGRYGQWAGGTHPTGMQSCFLLCVVTCGGDSTSEIGIQQKNPSSHYWI